MGNYMYTGKCERVVRVSGGVRIGAIQIIILQPIFGFSLFHEKGGQEVPFLLKQLGFVQIWE